MAQKKTTLEDLARMVQGGFAEVHDKMDRGFAEVNEELTVIRTDIRNIKATLEDWSDLPVRVGVLERRVGVEK